MMGIAQDVELTHDYINLLILGVLDAEASLNDGTVNDAYLLNLALI